MGRRSKTALIACSKKKMRFPCAAERLYQGNLFLLSMQYCKQSEKFDKIYILSAKYGLLNLKQKIEPYDLHIDRLKKDKYQKWIKKVKKQMRLEGIHKDKIHFFAPKRYRQVCSGINMLSKERMNREVSKQGYQLNYLKKLISELPDKYGFDLWE